MDLKTILMIIGIIALIILIIHSIWASRRERTQVIRTKKLFTGDGPQIRTNIYPPQVTTPSTEISPEKEIIITENSNINGEPITAIESTDDHVIATNIEDNTLLADEDVSTETITIQEPIEPHRPISEPVQQSLDFSHPEPEIVEPEVEAEEEPKAQNNIETDILVMHIVTANHNEPFSGDLLVPTLESFSFSHGEHQIFHRHLDVSNTSPIVCSIANMVKPGTFDYNDMHNFSTLGITIFMQLPSAGNAKINFKNMFHTATNLAQQLNGILLNAERNEFTEQDKEEYLARIAKIDVAIAEHHKSNIHKNNF